MKLEDEIASKKFKSEFQKAAINIFFTNSWFNNQLKKELDKHGVTQQQFNILRILRGQHPKPSTINLLKERMLDKMSDASRIIERLVQKELVSRTQCDKDRRAVDIVITKQGLNLLSSFDIDDMIKKLIEKNITEKEAVTLNYLLDKLRG